MLQKFYKLLLEAYKIETIRYVCGTQKKSKKHRNPACIVREIGVQYAYILGKCSDYCELDWTYLFFGAGLFVFFLLGGKTVFDGGTEAGD